MNKNPYLYNNVANSLMDDYNERLLENENVDSLLVKICDNALNAFKIICFDIAHKRDRNPDKMRAKLSDIVESKTVKSLTAKMLDYAQDSDITNNKFAEAKRLYTESLQKFTEALDSASEISKDKSEVIFKQFKLSCTKLQNSIDNIAKIAEEEEKEKSNNEAESYSYSEAIYETIFTGYADRVKNIKKVLTNLITSSEGKDQKNGYGRDWKRIFLDLDERRKVIDNGENRERNKKMLEELEKQLEKNQEDFNNAIIQAANRTLQQLEDDEEIYTKYSDVTNLLGQALDLSTRAKTQYGLAIKDIKDEAELKEIEAGKTVFPIKRGDSDSNKRFKNSGIVTAIQNALINGISSASELLRERGGADGKYGSATASIIATIQKVSGNKNSNGELDKSLLEEIVSSDWVSERDKKAIHKALDVIKSKMNEGKNYVLPMSSFFPLYEGKISINQSEFGKELKSQVKIFDEDLNFKNPEQFGESSDILPDVQALAKKLRNSYSIKIEGDDFLRSDGSLKSSYTHQFIKEWKDSLDKADPAEDYSYFFTNGGVYNINLQSTTLKTPCNWKKWSSARGISNDMDDEDSVDFIKNYLNGWKTFGMINPEYRYDGIKQIIKKNSDENFELSGPYEMMSATVQNKEIPFISYSDLKGDISKAFNIVLQSNEKSPDLNQKEFIAINNFLIMISNCISFDGDKYISCAKWIQDNVLSDSMAKRIASDTISGLDEGNEGVGQVLSYEGSKIVMTDYKLAERKKSESEKKQASDLSRLEKLSGMTDSSMGIKRILGNNSYYIMTDIYPSIKNHLKRMNSSSFEDVPQVDRFKCVNGESR